MAWLHFKKDKKLEMERDREKKRKRERDYVQPFEESLLQQQIKVLSDVPHFCILVH